MTSFTNLRFRYPFRRYQQMVLDVLDGEAGDDHKLHVVAPPGAGKTIVGLELIRRFGRPAVVFCPTTTIQQQWREKVGMFTADPAWLDAHTSLDPRRLADINVLTYQVLSTPGENLEFVERIAVERWVDDLLSSGKAATDTEAKARQRIATLKEANPKAHRREVAKRYRRVKREFLRDRTLDGRQFLHPNARDLIERIVALGTGTVVLDECHHLLDYWAFILRELIHALPGVRVVGLTATLPDPANPTEYENYASLLGDVDFEVPTPAVVKEGNLAPYRDLVYFCQPSPREHAYLDEIQQHFEAVVWKATKEPAFQDWLWGMLFSSAASRARTGGPSPTRPGAPAAWEPPPLVEGFADAFKREPLLCIAAIKYLLEIRVPLPLDLPLVDETAGQVVEPLTIDDWLILMENYALRALKLSADPAQQALYRDLCAALLPFGITISERGIRHGRSPGDLVLALSEAKDRATVDILRAESETLEDLLRAVVITDYERLSARTRRLKGVLDPDAGSAVRVFRRLVADPVTELLVPVLVTGRIVLVAARGRSLLEDAIRRWAVAQRADFSWEWRETESEQVLQLAGSGRDWSSRTYVALLTDLFEQGLTRCLVGTRGILGEGWDSLRLNTLVDLTSVTTKTGVQQIRGRTIRLDPGWPRKVAHNWDVVCISPDFEKGDYDLRRFVARHAHTWGIVAGEAIPPSPQPSPHRGEGASFPPSGDKSLAPWRGLGEGKILHRSPFSPLAGRIVRGVAHVDPNLAAELAAGDFQRLDYGAYTRQMLDAVWERDAVYDLWDVGGPYDNQVYSTARVEGQDLNFRTTHTVGQSLRTMLRRTLTSLVAVGATAWVNGAGIAAVPGLPWLPVTVAGLTGTAAATTVAVNGHRLWQVFRRAFLDLPADAILKDMGQALLAALRDAGGVDGDLTDDCLRVVETAAGSFKVLLEAASAEDAHTFVHAYRQMLGPLGDARYLIERDSTSLRNPVYRASWRFVRGALRLDDDLKAYHRVPDVLASRRELAEMLARHWQRYVGGGRLVYTRNPEGRRILLEARADGRATVRQMAFELWR